MSNDSDSFNDAISALQALQGVQNDAADSSGGSSEPTNDAVIAYNTPGFKPDPESKIESIALFTTNVSVKNDVFLSEEEIHPCTTKKDNPPMTRIWHIRGVTLVKIDAKDLQKYCAKTKRIKNVANKSKKALCQELIMLKLADDAFGSRPEETNVSVENSAKKTTRIILNYYRFVNVLSLDAIKPLLLSLSGAFARADMDAGKKAGSDLWKALAEKYNDDSIQELDEIKWGFALPSNKDPPSIHPGVVDSVRMQNAFKLMRSEYTTFRNRWTTSGNGSEPFEEDFEEEDAVPFENFVNGKYQYVYLHCLLREQQDLLVTITRDFDDDAIFSESTNTSVKKGKNKKKRRSSSSDDDDIQFQLLASMRERTQVIQSATAAETAAHEATTLNQLTDARDKAKRGKMESYRNLLALDNVADAKEAKSVLRRVAWQRQDEEDRECESHELTQDSIEEYSQRFVYGADLLDYQEEEAYSNKKIREQMKK